MFLRVFIHILWIVLMLTFCSLILLWWAAFILRYKVHFVRLLFCYFTRYLKDVGIAL